MIRHNILDIFNERIYELGIKQKYIAEKTEHNTGQVV